MEQIKVLGHDMMHGLLAQSEGLESLAAYHGEYWTSGQQHAHLSRALAADADTISAKACILDAFPMPVALRSAGPNAGDSAVQVRRPD